MLCLKTCFVSVLACLVMGYGVADLHKTTIQVSVEVSEPAELGPARMHFCRFFLSVVSRVSVSRINVSLQKSRIT